MSHGPAPAGRGPVWRLAVAETLVYAGLYYSFPALLPVWEREEGWSRTALGGALTAAMVAWALAAPLAGRLVDRDRGALALGLGMATGGAALALTALAPSEAAFWAGWIAVGAGLGLSTYEPCFAHVLRRRGAAARRDITHITLVAGFAGTLAFPLAHLLGETLGWRPAVAILGAGVALLAAPLAFTGARDLARAAPGLPEAEPAAPGAARAGLGRLAFWFLGLSFSAVALGHSLVIAHLLPLLGERGIGAGTAVLAAAMIGPMQVAGRLLMLAFERRASNRTVTLLSLAAIALAALALHGSAGLPALAALFVLLQGGGMGVMSIMKPMVTRDLLGPRDLGLVVGALALPAVLASAAGPLLGALLWRAGTYELVTLALLGLGLAGLAAFLIAARAARA